MKNTNMEKDRKYKKALAAIPAAIVIIAVMLTGCKSSMISVVSGEGNIVTVSAENAGEDSGGTGQVMLEEGQVLVIEAELEEDSSIQIEVRQEGEEEVLVEEMITGEHTCEAELPAGVYNVSVTAQKGATGSMTIGAK